MKVGTKSVLFGAHQFMIHPIFLAIGWYKLYGFPYDPRLWLAFIVHDLGYWGKANMDGEEGERHVEFGANLMRRLFGDNWGDLCLYHSRYWAKRNDRKPSKLCFADKMALVVTPTWVHVLLTNLSGEVKEYRALRGEGGKYSHERERHGLGQSDYQMYKNMRLYLVEWIAKHKDGADDTWTP